MPHSNMVSRRAPAPLLHVHALACLSMAVTRCCLGWLERSLLVKVQTAVRCECRVLVVALAVAAVCAPSSAAGAAKQTTYSDYASLVAPAMLLAHGDWEVRAPPLCLGWQCAERFHRQSWLPPCGAVSLVLPCPACASAATGPQASSLPAQVILLSSLHVWHAARGPGDHGALQADPRGHCGRRAGYHWRAASRLCSQRARVVQQRRHQRVHQCGTRRSPACMAQAQLCCSVMGCRTQSV